MTFELENSDVRRVLRQVLTADIKQINHCRARKGAVLGEHYHKNATEYFYTLDGEASLEYGWNYENKFILDEHSCFEIPKNTLHRLTCFTDLEFMTFLTEPHAKDNPDIWTV